MSDARSTYAAALTLEMRAPLARVGLLASQLEREAPTPRARALALAICEAAGELDHLIARSLAVLAPRAGTPESETDVRPMLEALRQRVAPALAARGLDWEPPPASPPVEGDEECLRQAVIHALREIAGRAPGPRRLSIVPIQDGPRYGAAVDLEGEDARDLVARTDEMAELQRYLVSRGGVLEGEPRAGGARLRLWLPHRSRTCSAS